MVSSKHTQYTFATLARVSVSTHLHVCRRIGIEARKKVIAPVGAWFSQVGRLHQVHHIWQYKLAFSLSLILQRFILAL